jgi:hypothetical protein
LDVVTAARHNVWLNIDTSFGGQPNEILRFDEFSLMTPGRYIDTFKSDAKVLCKDGVTRQVCV